MKIATFSTELKNAVTRMGDRTNVGLWTRLSDQNAAAAFASSGALTGDPAHSVPQQLEEISSDLKV